MILPYVIQTLLAIVVRPLRLPRARWPRVSMANERQANGAR